jgi:hypothetical protein
VVRKVVNNNDAGDSTHFGGNDLDYINNFNGVDQSGSDPVIMGTTGSLTAYQSRIGGDRFLFPVWIIVTG